MTATLAAGAIGPSTPQRRQHLARGMAAAGALSLVVHAAVLFLRISSGGDAVDGSPAPAPVLLTRMVVAPEPATAAKQEPPPPVPPAAPAVQPSPPEAARVETVIATPDRDAAKARPTASPPPPPAAMPERAPAVPPPTVRPSAEPPVAAEVPATAAPPSPNLTYHGAIGLDPPPRPLGDIEPVVPEAAGARGGLVVLRLYISEHGSVDRAEVLRSTPPGLFDASAVEAFSNAKFSPGYLAGVPVKSQMTIEVKYKALGSGSESSTRTY